MRFGRVEGFVAPPDPADRGLLRLTVTLETGRGRIEVIRDESVAVLRPIAGPADLAWHADQYTQETIGVQLAEAGWEPIGQGEAPPPEPNAPARSASYAVRNLT
jgi:virulence-associated protein VagC